MSDCPDSSESRCLQEEEACDTIRQPSVVEQFPLLNRRAAAFELGRAIEQGAVRAAIAALNVACRYTKIGKTEAAAIERESSSDSLEP
jgi:hypothetical protein